LERHPDQDWLFINSQIDQLCDTQPSRQCKGIRFNQPKQMYTIYNQKLCTPSGYMAKILLIMRLTTLILFSVIMQVSASSYAQKINLLEKNASLMTVFDKISEQTGFDFIVTSDMLKKANLVNIKVSNAEMPAVLKEIFKDQPLEYSVKDKIVVVSKKEPTLLDKISRILNAYTLRGIVVNERNEPLAGANVMVRGQNRGYGTTQDGRFILSDIDGSEMLITSYVGYRNDTTILTGGNNITIRLLPITNNLSEVAVISTGYQELSKERATGSYGKPDMKIFSERIGSNDLISRLDGLVAGVTVNASGIGKGANRYGTGTNQQSVIRGISSVNLSAEPLYVVDGVQVPNLSYLNPNDVEDVSVLKDAAAAAIYGAKAANGVIVITTKKGKRDQQLHFNYNGAFTFSGRPRFDKDFYMNSAQYIATAKEIFDPVNNPAQQLSYGFIAPHEDILYKQYQKLITDAQATKSLDSLSKIDNRDQVRDLIYQNAFSKNNTISVAGGSKLYAIYSSVSHVNTQTNTPGQSNNSYLFNVNQTINPVSWMNIGLNTALNKNIAKAKYSFDVGPGFLPYQLFQDGNGTPLTVNYMTGWSADRQADYQARSRINLDYIPLEEVDKGYTKSNLLNLNTSASVQIRFWKGLSFQGNYGYQRSSGTSESYLDHTSLDLRKELLNFTKANTPADEPVYYLPAAGGRFTTINRASENWTVRNQLVYNTRLRNGKDQLNLQLGQEILEQSSIMNTNILRGYDDVLKTYSLLDYVTLSKPLFGAIGSGYSMFNEKPFVRLAEKSRFKSIFGLFNYSISDIYMIDASIRQDKSSLFASDEAAQNDPAFSVGAKWLLSREKWMPKLNWINNLALRATYGVTGNSPYVGAASTFDILYAGSDTNFGNYLTVSQAANNKLSWEATHTWNFGLDFGLLNHRLNGSTDVYFKNTKGLIGSVEFNPLNGTETATGNIGNIKNSGIELTLNSRNILSKDFNWSTSFVFSYNHNKLVSYAKPLQYLTDALSQVGSSYQIGYARPSLFAFRYAGLDALGDPQIYRADGTITKEPYAAKPEDLVYMGTTQPKYNGGLSNTFRYKQLSLTVNLVYNLGAVMRGPAVRYPNGRLTVGSFSDGNLYATFADRWKQPGDEKITNIPSFSADPNVVYNRRDLNYYNYADINVISASYVKLRDVTLSYDLAPSLFNALKLQRASVFAQTGNFLLWTKNDVGVDPEVGFGQHASRTLNLGINVAF
jgi:TonB-linked SusC/RagA family outer membrane protein